jgi:hypothetical protein
VEHVASIFRVEDNQAANLQADDAVWWQFPTSLFFGLLLNPEDGKGVFLVFTSGSQTVVPVPGGTRRIGWGYAKIIFVMAENKNTKTKLWSFGLQRETYVKVVTRLAHH